MTEPTRLLVVDDRHENRYYLLALLEASGYVITLAHDGAEALLKARADPPDLIISDLLMPVMDGYTLLRNWKADDRLREIPFIVYTATYTEPEDERLALSLGADAFILKPAEPDQFLTRLRGILEAGWSRPPAEPEEPAGRDAEVLRRYTDTLIRKLGEKTRQLEATNDALTKDIAERKRAEESLRDSESFLRMAGRIGRLGAWAADARSLTLTWSDELSAIYEAAPGSVRTLQQAMSFVEPPFRTEFESAVRACIRQGVPFDLELRIVTGRGRRAWVRSIGEAVRDDDGRTLRLQGAQQDITPRKEGELALAESEERFRLLARATNDAIWDWDLETNRIWWSDGFETLFGSQSGEDAPTLEGWTARVHPDDREIVMASMRHALGSEEERWSAEYRFRLGDGGYASVFDHGQIIRDEGGVAIRMIGGMSDTTERKRLESHLLRTQRMENMGAVAGGMVHDLNNVLMPIMMAAALLKEQERDSDRLSMLESIEAGARRGTEMVRQVMAFGRGVEGRSGRIDLGALVDEVRTGVRSTFPKDIEFVVNAPDELWTVHADATQLHQVVTNLCINARDAMESGGRLAVDLENLTLDRSDARLPPECPPGPYVCLRVTDTGAGIDPEVLARIFEPFFTTKAAGKGTGLGLATVQAIVRSHDGFMDVESGLGEGTRFSIHLPATPVALPETPVALPETPVASEATQDMSGRGELVLVVDDEDGSREITRRMLERFGYRVVVAANGADAVSLYAERRGEVSLVLTDMTMPGMDGAATMLELRGVDPDVIVVAASGNTSAEAAENARRAGARDFITKPYTAETLLRKLHGMLHQPT